MVKPFSLFSISTKFIFVLKVLNLQRNDQFQTNFNLSAQLFFDTLIWKVCKTDKIDEKKI